MRRRRSDRAERSERSERNERSEWSAINSKVARYETFLWTTFETRLTSFLRGLVVDRLRVTTIPRVRVDRRVPSVVVSVRVGKLAALRDEIQQIAREFELVDVNFEAC